MKSKTILGAIICLALTGCGSTSSSNLNEELPIKGEENLVGSTNTTESTESTDIKDNDVEILLPEGTYIREIKDGYLKETQIGNGYSHYRIAYGNEESLGTKEKLLLEFKSISNIGSWEEENPDTGVWRWIDDNTWFTAIVWAGGYIPEANNTLLKINDTNIIDIKEMLSTYTVFEETIEMRRTDKYVSAMMKVDRVDEGLSGYVVIIDDLDTSYRWIVQFMMLSESADFDLLKDTAESVAIGTEFNMDTLKTESMLCK